MAGLDFSQVSSNWKKLQEKLKSQKDTGSQSNGLKRKRPEEQRSTVKAFKKTKLQEGHPNKTYKKRRMGTGESKPTTNGDATNDRSTLVKDHGIAPGDVSAAYGSNTGARRSFQDDVNSGLHATHKPGKYIALDCEMVGTGPPPYTDDVLARASLVNFHGEQIYDSYVLPPPKVKVGDYRTHVSGIRASQMVEGYARPFAEVQRDVAALLEGKILVGHALKNDLQALLLSHPKHDLRDTSRHPKFRVESKGKPPALRNLAKSELGMSIQTGEHSSIEDARAAMLLFKKEKAGFEEENRKTFGQSRRLDKKAASERTAPPTQHKAELDESDDEEDEEDLELLAGEDDDHESTPAAGRKTVAAKKRKKKKRTKRH